MNLIKNYIYTYRKIIIILLTGIVVGFCSYFVSYLINNQNINKEISAVSLAKVNSDGLKEDEIILLKEMLIKPIDEIDGDFIPEDQLLSSKEVNVKDLNLTDNKGKALTIIGVSKKDLNKKTVFIDNKYYKINLNNDGKITLENYKFAKKYVLSLNGNKILVCQSDSNGNLIVEKTHDKNLTREEARTLFENGKLQVDTINEVKDYLSSITS